MVWSWAFGNETEADLESLGFNLFFTSFPGAGAAFSAESTSVDPLNAYTYSGSPTRYSLGIDTDGTNAGRRIVVELEAIENYGTCEDDDAN